MSQIDVERFLGRILTDTVFRMNAKKSLERTCYCKGFNLSAKELALLGKVDYDLFDQLSEIIDDSLKRS